MHALALLVLMATVGSTEQSYGPYRPPARGDAHSIAVARNRMLLAWSEIPSDSGRAAIHIALLNSQGRLVGSIHTIPAARATADALEPVVTSTATGFTVTWRESDATPQIMSLSVDAAGVPIGTPQVIERRPRQGSRALLRVGVGLALGCANCGPLVPHYFIDWTNGSRKGTYDTGKELIHAIGVTRDGEPLAVVWSVPRAVVFFVPDRGTGSVWAEAEFSAAPGIACDATDCVIAYGSASGDVHGITFPVQHPTWTSVFTIAASERRERAPQVHLLRDGRFFVTYQSDGVGGRMLSGRLVSLDETKRRAMR
jgi:hypothetical protein